MSKNDVMNQYGDLIHMPRPVSKQYPQMPMNDRAEQFIAAGEPDAEQTGLQEAVRSIGTGRQFLFTYTDDTDAAVQICTAAVSVYDRNHNLIILDDGRVLAAEQIIRIEELRV